MKIRLISDLHIDINEKYPLDLHKDGANDVYTLVAGDICGSPVLAAEWMKKNVHQGAFISGNHDVYNTAMAIEDIKQFFHKEFPENGNIVYFDNDVGVISKELPDGKTLLVADVLYTDYKLPILSMNASGNPERNMHLADPWHNMRGGMNDFNYGKCKKMYVGWNDAKLSISKIYTDSEWRLVPPWYREHHERAFEKITEIVEANKDKQILLMAHHGLSPQCLDENYHENSNIDASYVSDKEDWIKNHPNIKCIFSGHIHARKKFKIGDCLYVMNALGYCSYHLEQYDKDLGKYVAWTPDCIIDTDSWKVEWMHNANKEWEDAQRIENEKLMKLAPFLI